MQNSELVKITDNISYLPGTRNPFNGDNVFIKTENATWIFDVGCTKKSREIINSVDGIKNIVISHFHIDHIFNLPMVKYDNLYVSQHTKKYSKKGTVVTKMLEIEDNPQIKIVPVSSSHTKGSLALICGDYAFLGDATYCVEKINGKHLYNAQLLQAMINELKSMPVKYMCLSHEPVFVKDKEAVIDLYKDIYKRAEPGNPWINVDDYFNDDGSVKISC